MGTIIRACKACGWNWRQESTEDPACPRCAKSVIQHPKVVKHGD